MLGAILLLRSNFLCLFCCFGFLHVQNFDKLELKTYFMKASLEISIDRSDVSHSVWFYFNRQKFQVTLPFSLIQFVRWSVVSMCVFFISSQYLFKDFYRKSTIEYNHTHARVHRLHMWYANFLFWLCILQGNTCRMEWHVRVCVYSIRI